MVKFQSLAPNLVVDDVNKTVAFYAETLGFVKIASVPETGQWQWAMVMRDGVTLMFQSLPSIQEDLPRLNIEKKGCMGTFYIGVESIDELYKDVKGKADIPEDM
ncbi:MAG TPA: VOC family protein, partial [Ohtaekwangia sp.]|nr:VOC family protein [Ohtaekwangia sp.]